jgi:branched-chain amino acid transport system ATP-binding protein
MLDIEGLAASYGSIPVLKDVSIKIPGGQVVSIIGANGAGKTTLLKTISGLIKPQAGRILFQGKNIAGMPADRVVGLGISQVPEGRQLFAHLTVLDNLNLGAYLYFKRRNHSEIRQSIEDIYRIFPILKNRSKQIAGTLSGGEQQMLAIGRALMGRPRLLLLDEPSMGIAPLIVHEIFQVIQSLNASGTTILLVEQNARAALNVAHFCYVLERGEIVLEGLASELLHNPKVKAVYLGG